MLTGGNSNNTLVVNDVDGTIYVGGVARAVTQWQGRVVLDNKTNMLAFPEHYVVTIALGNHARVEIADTGGGSASTTWSSSARTSPTTSR